LMDNSRSRCGLHETMPMLMLMPCKH